MKAPKKVIKQVKIENTYFNASSIEMMGFNTFRKVYSDNFKSTTVEDAFTAITGKKPPVKTTKKEE